MKTSFKFKSETKLPMNTRTQPQTAFALGMIMAACSLPLYAQQNPPPSRFNVELGSIRAPNVPTEIPAASWDSALINGANVSFTADRKEVFLSNRVDGNHDLYVARRATPNDPWGAVQPVGAPVNSA